MSIRVEQLLAKAFAKKRAWLRQADLVEITGLRRQTIRPVLKKLEEEGVLVREEQRFAPTPTARGCLFLAEGLLLRARDLLQAHTDIPLIYREALRVFQPPFTLLVFGSTLEDPLSAGDRDILILAERIPARAWEDFQMSLLALLSREPHVVTRTHGEWRRMVRDQKGFARVILTTAVPLLGMDWFACEVITHRFHL